MTASQLDEEVLFNAARQIGDGAARAQYLRDAAGGDEGLLRRVEALLATNVSAHRSARTSCCSKSAKEAWALSGWPSRRSRCSARSP
jgi:hypothetical protein